MDNKLMAQVFSDAISSSESPVMVNGAIYKERRGYINVTPELIEAMQFAQRELYCKHVRFGNYDCYEETKSGVPVDGCLVGEINRLNDKGVITTGCCCGHGKHEAFIQVISTHVNKMLELGYEKRPIDENLNGEYCFIPKTILPKT